MIEDWGETPCGASIQRITLGTGGLMVRVLSFGAALQDMRLEGHDFPLILNYPSCAPYLSNPQYFGAVIGRVANRIAHGRAVLNGDMLALERNCGPHHLHGGRGGSSFRNWQVEDYGADFAVLSDTLPDGHMGYPGHLQLRITYRVAGESLSARIEAQTDAATFCNLALHPYFHLDDAVSLKHHRLRIDADHFTEVDSEGIPTGQLAPVAGAFDFRVFRALEGQDCPVLDHNFCLASARRAPAEAAELVSEKSGISLRLVTTEPGVQVYGLPHENGPGLAGIALEAQGWPDAPNHPAFPSVLLLPGEVYQQETRYVFRA